MTQIETYMPFINWDNSFRVNIDSIDEQHKKIMEMINDLHDSITEGAARRNLNEALVRLSVYMVKHFVYEENLFKKHNYKYQKEHKKDHDELAESITEFHKWNMNGKCKLVSDQVEFFKNKMHDHILNYDQKYVSHMYSHGVK